MKKQRSKEKWVRARVNGIPIRNAAGKYYAVSDQGRIKRHRGRILNPFKGNKFGHMKIDYNRYGGTGKRFAYVHRLVAEAFLELPQGYEWEEFGSLVINHKDGHPYNNHADNLEIVTPWDNSVFEAHIERISDVLLDELLVA